MDSLVFKWNRQTVLSVSELNRGERKMNRGVTAPAQLKRAVRKTLLRGA